jgi:hypothetical protein
MPLDDILDRHRDIKKPSYNYQILVRGPGFEPCKKKVLSFFEKYQLVRFSVMTLDERVSISAEHPSFQERLQEAIVANRSILKSLIGELQAEKLTTLNDLNALPQGYKTKLLHVVTHFLDGFFGVDTHFYNLIEDSHWVSEGVQDSIRKAPADYWLVSLETRI